MKDVSKHSEHYAAGAPYRRARASAWTVFWLTAGTSVLYNCYHALVDDRMPWYTGVPEGVLPLVVAIGVIEFSGAWRKNVPLQVAAWAVTGGAMAWSALAINVVVHDGWALGLIGDVAALSAMYFLLNGPTAGQAVAEVARREAELTGARDGARAEVTEERRARQADVAALEARLTEAAAATEDWKAEAARVHRATVQVLEDRVKAARGEADTSAARVAVLERKLAGPAKRSASGSGRSGAAPRTGPGTAPGTAPEDDLDLEARALKLLATNLDMSGAELAEKLEISPGYGRKLRRRLAGDRPAGGEPDRSENRTGTAGADRTEDRP
jgi:hypothetical protein